MDEFATAAERPNLRNEFLHKGQRQHHRRARIALKRGLRNQRGMPKVVHKGESPEIISRVDATQAFIKRRKQPNPYPDLNQSDDLFQESRVDSKSDFDARRHMQEREAHRQPIYGAHDSPEGSERLTPSLNSKDHQKMGQSPVGDQMNHNTPPTYQDPEHQTTVGYSPLEFRDMRSPQTSPERTMSQTRHRDQKLENPFLLQKRQGRINNQPSLSQGHHYTISKDHTAGEMARRSNLLANFGKKRSSKMQQALLMAAAIPGTPGYESGMDGGDFAGADARGSFRVSRDRRSWLFSPGFSPAVTVEQAGTQEQTQQDD